MVDQRKTLRRQQEQARQQQLQVQQDILRQARRPQRKQVTSTFDLSPEQKEQLKKQQEQEKEFKGQLKDLKTKLEEAEKEREKLREKADEIAKGGFKDQGERDKRKGLINQSNIINAEAQAYKRLISELEKNRATIGKGDIKKFIKAARTEQEKKIQFERLQREGFTPRKTEVITITGAPPDKTPGDVKRSVSSAEFSKQFGGGPNISTQFVEEFGTPKGDMIKVEKPLSEVTIPEKPKGFFEQIGFSIKTESEKERIKEDKNIPKQFLLGATQFGVGTIGGISKGFQDIFGISTENDIPIIPEQTIKGYFYSGKDIGKRLISGEGAPEIGRTIKEKPFYSLGYTSALAGTSYLTGKAISKITPSGKIASDIKKAEKKQIKTIGTRFEGKKGGVDLLTGYKKAGKTQVVTKIKQPFYKTPTGVVLEQGKATTFLNRKGRTEVFGFDVAGRAKEIKTAPKISSVYKGVTTTTKAGDFQVGVGKITQQLTQRGRLKTKTGFDILNYKPKSITKGKIKLVYGSTKKTTKFLTASKGNKFIKTISGKAEKGRYNFLTGKKSVKGRITSKGIIKRINVDDFFGSGIKTIKKGKSTKPKSNIGGGTKQITQQKVFAPTVEQTQSLVKSTLKAEVSQQAKTISKTLAGGLSLSGIQKTQQQTKVISIPSSTQKPAIKEKSKVITTPLTQQIPTLKTNEISKVIPLSTTNPALKVKTKPKMAPLSLQISPPLSTPFPSPKILPLPLPQPKTEKKRRPFSKPTSKQSYNVFAKSKGKFKRISKNPLTRAQALNLGSWAVDNTLSAQFKLKKTKGDPKQSSYKVPAGYWSQSFGKFRGFKIRKGQKIGVTNNFIEKKSNRLDTSSEVQKIQLARFLSGNKRKSRKKSKKVGKNIGKSLLEGF